MAFWLRFSIPYIDCGVPMRAVCRACYRTMKFKGRNLKPVLRPNVTLDVNEIVPSISSADTLVSNELEFVTKLTKMASDGYDKLQIISDFDHTISVYCNGATKMLTTHEAIEMHPDVRHTTTEKLRDLRSSFLPLETNPCVSATVRHASLELWWSVSHSLLISEPITRKMIAEVETVAPIALRKDFVRFSNYLHDLQVPMTIFSAGLGDIIQQMLHKASVKMDTVSVLANFIKFDPNGNALEFQKPTIHSQNKTLSTILESDTLDSQRIASMRRPNVILLGDSVHDIDMIKGYHFNSVLKIGFLNQPTPSRVEEYKQAFDVVLIKQESFHVPLQLLKWICSVTRSIP